MTECEASSLQTDVRLPGGQEMRVFVSVLLLASHTSFVPETAKAKAIL